MSEISYFFDSSGAGVNYYTSSQVADWLYQAMGRPVGVFGGLDNSLNPSTSGSLNSTYNTGVATFGGRIYKNTASLPLTHAAPTSGYRRIDAVVVRFDNSTALAANLTIISGTEKNDGSQVAPSINSATDVLVSNVLIDNSAGSNTTTVTDKRWIITANSVLTLAAAASPYTMQEGAIGPSIFVVTTGASTFTFNLPTALGMIGRMVTVIKADSGVGVINITPNGSDSIGTIGNTSVSIGSQHQNMTLISTASGVWEIREFVVDTDVAFTADSDSRVPTQKAVLAQIKSYGGSYLIRGGYLGTSATLTLSWITNVGPQFYAWSSTGSGTIVAPSTAGTYAAIMIDSSGTWHITSSRSASSSLFTSVISGIVFIYLVKTA